MKSPRFSFQGWQFKEWLKGNLSTIKELAKVVAPFAAGWFMTNDPRLIGFITLVGKFLLDSAEYYIKEYK